jgi:hypothetical protein
MMAKQIHASYISHSFALQNVSIRQRMLSAYVSIRQRMLTHEPLLLHQLFAI